MFQLDYHTALAFSSAGAIFQRKMDQVLKGIPGVTCRVDDICITAPNDELHMERVAEVVKRLETSNFVVD